MTYKAVFKIDGEYVIGKVNKQQLITGVVKLQGLDNLYLIGISTCGIPIFKN